MEFFPEEAAKKKGVKNQWGKTLSFILGVYENAILHVITTKSEELGVPACSRMHDGFMSHGKDVPDRFAEQLTQAVHDQMRFSPSRSRRRRYPSST